ncbi:glycerophosphodiester phosphodiesterase family protein [Streptomyces sp. WAC 06725]|uniref:glycerophosphodiester phosphodiesterase n=1 Tax=Streptomyces sp. WAC 06725 TaxID=2203209 RepID=UPI00163CA386|nr:glycerophosphodiester phosphodiesterase family protein [Streptomyces sp. WAC 06725]
MIGHRGTAADENTLRGFRDAQRAGASGFELDVWWTRDGAPVVMHDPTVDRTTNRHGAIASLTATQVSRLRTARGERVPTLDEALRYAAGHQLTVLVELKPTPTPAQVRTLLAVIRATAAGRYVIVHSFNAEAVAAVRRAAPELRTALTHDKTPISGKKAAQYGTALNVSRFLATAKAVRGWHAAGLRVYAWTANWPPAWKKLKAASVEAVLTDRPAAYKEWARTACSQPGPGAQGRRRSRQDQRPGLLLCTLCGSVRLR